MLYFPARDMAARLLNNPEQHRELSEIFENYTGSSVDFVIKNTESDEMFDGGLYDLRNIVKPGTVNVPIDSEENMEEI